MSDIVTGAGSTDTVVSLEAFHAVLWSMFALCFLAFAARLYIRFRCFNRFLIDDYIMMFSLSLLLAIAVIGQTSLATLYRQIAFLDGKIQIPMEELPHVMETSLHTFGSAIIISLVGILAVKINFLVFFRRLGIQITAYLVFWWIVLVITVACGIINIGLIDYPCVFPTFTYLMTSCQTRDTLKRAYDFMRVSVSLDAFSDALIICFPIVILWKVRISLRRKLILSATFGLVSLTIAVTIVRGSVFGGAYKTLNTESKNLNLAWMWFWIYLEFAIAFLIACIISFRAIFAQRENREYQHQVELEQIAWNEQQQSEEAKKSGFLQRARKYHNSLLYSFMSLETGNNSMRLPEPESGRFSPAFLTEMENSTLAKERTNSMSDSGNRV